MSSSNLFRPLKLGKIELKHRVVMAPLTRLFTDEEHVRSPVAVEHYAQRASTGGLVIAEATVVSLGLGGGKYTPGIWTRANGAHMFLSIDSLEPLADAALSADKRERQASESSEFSSLSRCDSPSESPPNTINEEEIKSTTRAFVQAARNAMAAGFDGVEVGANGYFIYQSLHRHTSKYERVGFRMSPSSAFRMSSLAPEFASLTQQLKGLNLAYIHIIKSHAITNIECDTYEGIKPFLTVWGQSSPVLIAGEFTPESARSALDTEYPNSDVALVFGQQFLALQEAKLPVDDPLGFEISELRSLNASFYTGFV
jgi:NADPH2 dehydrogenase